MPFARICLLLLLAFVLPGTSAQVLRICADVRPHPPLMLADGSGTGDARVAAAVRAAGWRPLFQAQPIARCREGLARSTVDAFPLAAHDPALAAFSAYPYRGHVPDATRAVATLRVMVFRRKGETVSWNGTRFDGLAKPVLIGAGMVAVHTMVTAAQVPIDEGGVSLETNFDKLLAGRGDAVAGFEREAEGLLKRAEYADKVEMLPVPLGEQPMYLIFSKRFYSENREAAEAMWDALRRLPAPAVKR